MPDPRQTTGTPKPTAQEMAGGIPQNRPFEFQPPPVMQAQQPQIPAAAPAQLMPQAPPIPSAGPVAPPMAAPSLATPPQMANNPMMMQALMQRLQGQGR